MRGTDLWQLPSGEAYGARPDAPRHGGKAGLVYMSNIENDRRTAPSQEYLERMALLLQLDKPEREWMLDLAAKSKQNRVSADLPDYIMDREIVRAALRTAREADATDQEWQDFIDRINRRMRSSGEDSDTKA